MPMPMPHARSYTNDRLWRTLSLFASDQPWQWPPPTPLATHAYPFSTRPTGALSRERFVALARDVYRGASHASLDLTAMLRRELAARLARLRVCAACRAARGLHLRTRLRLRNEHAPRAAQWVEAGVVGSWLGRRVWWARGLGGVGGGLVAWEARV